MQVPALCNFRLCKISDTDLAERVAAHLTKMYQTGQLPSRNIPAQPDEDFDLLLGELLIRFTEKTAAQAAQ